VLRLAVRLGWSRLVSGNSPSIVAAMPDAFGEAAQLPAAHAQPTMPAAAAAPAPAVSATVDTRQRVLVVEDNLLNQELVVGYLERTEYKLTLAADGRKGVETFERERFDIVLMDWQMPEMDGLEATRRIRALEQTRGMRRTPIVAVTAHATTHDRDTCLAAGMDDYLIKPYSRDMLLQALRNWSKRA
jgi:CheY-like chemotaxis protein